MDSNSVLQPARPYTNYFDWRRELPKLTCPCGAEPSNVKLLRVSQTYHYNASGQRVPNAYPVWLVRCKDHAVSDWRPRTRRDTEALNAAMEAARGTHPTV